MPTNNSGKVTAKPAASSPVARRVKATLFGVETRSAGRQPDQGAWKPERGDVTGPGYLKSYFSRYFPVRSPLRDVARAACGRRRTHCELAGAEVVPSTSPAGRASAADLLSNEAVVSQVPNSSGHLERARVVTGPQESQHGRTVPKYGCTAGLSVPASGWCCRYSRSCVGPTLDTLGQDVYPTRVERTTRGFGCRPPLRMRR